MKTLKDKVAAITGAGSGIGRALALELATRGCHLALSDISAEGLAETARQAQSGGVRVTQATVNVAERAAVYGWADEVAREHGRVNAVFNNAGVALGSTVEGMSDEDFHWIMDINFWGVVYGTRAFLPHLKASGEGHVVNISSVFGLIGLPSQSAYNASKFAVRGFTEALRQELELAGSRVSATSVHPGGIKTNIAKSARFGADMKSAMAVDEAGGKQAMEKMFMTTPQDAAKTILRAVLQNKRRVLIGPDAHAIDLMVRLMPTAYQSLVTTFTRVVTRK